MNSFIDGFEENHPNGVCQKVKRVEHLLLEWSCEEGVEYFGSDYARMETYRTDILDCVLLDSFLELSSVKDIRKLASSINSHSMIVLSFAIKIVKIKGNRFQKPLMNN